MRAATGDNSASAARTITAAARVPASSALKAGFERKVSDAGNLAYNGRQYYACKALAGEKVWCRKVENRLLVTYRHMYIREIELDTGRTTAVVRPMSAPEV